MNNLYLVRCKHVKDKGWLGDLYDTKKNAYAAYNPECDTAYELEVCFDSAVSTDIKKFLEGFAYKKKKTYH